MKEKQNYTVLYILFVIAILWIIFLTVAADESTFMYYAGWVITGICTLWFLLARLKKQKYNDIYFTLFITLVYTIAFYITK